MTQKLSKEEKKKRKQMREKEQRESDDKMVDAKCPGCGKEHKVRIFWTGRLPARLNCKACNQRRAHVSDSLVCGGKSSWNRSPLITPK